LSGSHLALDLGEPPVDLSSVGFSNPAGVVGVEEVDVDAAGAVGLEGNSLVDGHARM
jgi:hypothetical protein